MNLICERFVCVPSVYTIMSNWAFLSAREVILRTLLKVLSRSVKSSTKSTEIRARMSIGVDLFIYLFFLYSRFDPPNSRGSACKKKKRRANYSTLWRPNAQAAYLISVETLSLRFIFQNSSRLPLLTYTTRWRRTNSSGRCSHCRQCSVT